MTIEQAIQKAIKNGWDVMKVPSFDGVEFLNNSEVCLDPLFWQALGKGLGWKETYYCLCSYEDWTCGELGCSQGWSEWQYYWHKLIDHLANNGTIESFFELL